MFKFINIYKHCLRNPPTCPIVRGWIECVSEWPKSISGSTQDGYFTSGIDANQPKQNAGRKWLAMIYVYVCIYIHTYIHMYNIIYIYLHIYTHMNLLPCEGQWIDKAHATCRTRMRFTWWVSQDGQRWVVDTAGFTVSPPLRMGISGSILDGYQWDYHWDFNGGLMG